MPLTTLSGWDRNVNLANELALAAGDFKWAGEATVYWLASEQ